MTSEEPTSDGPHDAAYIAVPLLSSIAAILKDAGAIKIFKKIKPNFKVQGILNSVKNLRDVLSSSTSRKNSAMKAYNQSMKSFKKLFSSDIYTQSVTFCVCRIEDTIHALEVNKTKKTSLNKIKKEYSLLQDRTDFTKIDQLDRNSVKEAIDVFQKYLSELKNTWQAQGFNEICWRSQNKEYIDRLESDLNNLLLLAELNYRIQKLEKALEKIKQDSDEIEQSPQLENRISTLFQKKTSNTSKLMSIPIEPIEIGPNIAIPEEKELMESRITLYDSIIQLSKQYPKPYEKRDELKAENQLLKKKINNGNIPKEVFEELKQDNENLKSLIEKLERQKEEAEDENPFGF